ncbi:RNA-directed DNA polymerase (Reverse transcriptase), partial [Trifolium medium]|nr:RNA-directed DNA polymerase (Reverse transcriptase) [Trifolium medium]
TKLLQVTRAVEKEVKGGGGSSMGRGPRSGFGPSRNGYQGGSRNGSDWVMVRREGGVKSGGNGFKGDNQAQNEKKRNGPRDRGFTHLSYNELMERKQKGLCFKCGGPFHPMHKCPDKQLKVLVVDDEEGED